MAFEPINTQEEFDKAISARIQRERETLEKKYAGFDEFKAKAEQLDELKGKDFEGQIKKLQDDLAAAKEKADAAGALEQRANQAELSLKKIKVATSNGLALELADRLSGTTDEELEADAKMLAGLTSGHKAPPMKSTEGAVPDEKTAALRKALENLKINE